MTNDLRLSTLLQQSISAAIKSLYSADIDPGTVVFQETRKEFEGDITLVVFPYIKLSKGSPEATSEALGNFLLQNNALVSSFNVVKGFLNIVIRDNFWISFAQSTLATKDYGSASPTSQTVMVEYSSPNTNKPLHLGHIRNNLLGYSVAEILKVNGHKVLKVNLINDRGIHICKSMLAWQKFGNGETPLLANLKGDHLVGKYYVRFDKEYKSEIEALVSNGMNKEEAEKKAPLILEAQQMLLKWERGDKETVALWEKMNEWVYEGFDVTYKKLGVDFDKTYYESNTYLLGKKLVEQGLQQGIFFQKADGSIWIDLTDIGLDQKLLLRGDGTSVYITQDIGTAQLRFDEFQMDKLIYVVGNEQDYHFQVLKAILHKMGRSWADGIEHLSYGMVDLPSGKMKSREGTVVDADELIDEMVDTAKKTTQELGKTEDLSNEKAAALYHQIGLGALKYFILKVDPKKRMLFNPEESIDFNGNTGPFIQYTHARICSILRKAKEKNIVGSIVAIDSLHPKEKEVIKILYQFPVEIQKAGEEQSPAVIANYVYELAKIFNQFYHEHSVLNEPLEHIMNFRLALSAMVAQVISKSLNMLGIAAPEQM